MAFKDRLKEARLIRDFTQEQLGQFIGVAKSTITGYEKGNSEPDVMKMKNLMAVLGVDANYLLQDEMAAVPNKSSSSNLSMESLEVAKAYETADLKSKNIARQALDLPPIKSQNSMEVAKESYIEKELQAYRKELEAEEKGKMSPASEGVKEA